MRILALGVDHRSAPTAVREALAFEGERRRRGLDALKDKAPDAEFVLLSTCNRVELYAAAESDPPDGEALAGFLARSHDVPIATLDRHLRAALRSAATAEGTAVLSVPDDLRRRGPLDRQPGNRPGPW